MLQSPPSRQPLLSPGAQDAAPTNHAMQVQAATQNVQLREQAGRIAFQQAQQGASTLAPQDGWGGVGGGGGEGLVGSGGITPNQFDPSNYSNPDPATEAAACGPAAYAALTAYLGRPATMDEAVAWAQANGWNQSGGMNGFANFEAMLAKKGLPVTAATGEPDWDRIYANAAQQIPSVVSTQNHYFVIEGLGPNGTFDTEGAYGAGREYLTADQIRSLGGGINGSVVMNQGVQRGPMTMAENQAAPTAQDFSGLPDLTGGTSAAAPAGTSGRYATDTNGRPIIMADGRGDKYIQLADGTWEPYGAPKPATASQTGTAILGPGQIAVGPNGNILASNPNPAARDALAQAQLNYQASLAQIQRQWQADRDTAAYNKAKLALDTWIENEKAKLGRMSLQASSALKDRELAQPIAGAQGAMWWPSGVLGSAFNGEYGMDAGSPDAAPTWQEDTAAPAASPAVVAANAAPAAPPSTGLPGSPAVPVATNPQPKSRSILDTAPFNNNDPFDGTPPQPVPPYNSGNVDQDYPGGVWPDAQPVYGPAQVPNRADLQSLDNSPLGQVASSIGNAVGSVASMRDPVKDAWNGLTSGLAHDVSAWAQAEMAKRQQQMHPYNSGSVDQEVPGMPDLPWPDNRPGSGGGEAMPMDPSMMQRLGAGPDLGAPAQVPPGGMVPPVDPSQVVGQGNAFGEQTGQEQPYHKGTDFQAVQGTPAVSPVDGMVIFTGDRGDLGLSVIVLDDAGQSHEENHLSKIDVQMGDQVQKGQPLGAVGSTGNSTGAHLDYRVRQPNGDFANPESLPPVQGALAGKQDMSGASPQQIMEEMPGMPGEVPNENEQGELPMGMGGGEGWSMVGSGGMMTSEGWREDLADTPENQASYGGSRPGDDGVATPAPAPDQHYAPGGDVDYTGWNQDEWRAGGNGWGTGPAQEGMKADPNHYAPDQADWTGWDWKGWQDAAAAGKPAASAAMPVARPAAAPAGTMGWPGVDQATHDMFVNTYGSEEAGKAAWQWEHDNPGAGSYYNTNHWLDRAQTPAPAAPVVTNPQTPAPAASPSAIQPSGWDALDPETKALFEGTYPGHGREAWEYQNAHPGEPYTGQNLTTANAQPKPGDPGTSTTTQQTGQGPVQVVRDQYGNEFWYQNGKLVYSRPAYDPTQLNAQTAATLQIQQQQLEAQAAQQKAQLDAQYQLAQLNAKSAQDLANIRIEYQKQKDAIDAQLQRESNALAERLGMAGYQRDLGVAATNAQGNVLSTWGAAAARSPWLARMSGRTPMAGDAGSRAAGDTSLIPGQSAQSSALLNTITNQNQADQGAFDQWQDYATPGQYSGGSLGWGGGESLQDGMGWSPTNGLLPGPLPQDASWHDVGVGGADDTLNQGVTTSVGTSPVVPTTPTPGVDSTPANTSGTMTNTSTQSTSSPAPATTAGGFGTTSMTDSGLPVASSTPAPASPPVQQAPTFTGPAGNQITLPTPQEYEAMGPYERASLRYGLESAGIPWEQVTDAMLGGWRDLGLSTASGLSGYGPQHRSNLGYDLMDPTQREDAWQMGELFMPQSDYQERETRWNLPTMGRTAIRA